jgi:hypothetical protein
MLEWKMRGERRIEPAGRIFDEWRQGSLKVAFLKSRNKAKDVQD